MSVTVCCVIALIAVVRLNKVRAVRIMFKDNNRYARIIMLQDIVWNGARGKQISGGSCHSGMVVAVVGVWHETSGRG